MSVHGIYSLPPIARITHAGRVMRMERRAAILRDERAVYRERSLLHAPAAVDRERFVSKIAAKLTVILSWLCDREIARESRAETAIRVISLD